MSDTTDTAVVDNSTTTEPVEKQSEQPSIEELMKKFDALAEENTRLKGSVSRKDKDLLTLQKEKTELVKEKMSVEEKAKHDAAEEKKIILAEMKALQCDALEIDEEISSLLDGNSSLEIKEKAEMLKKYKGNVLKEANNKISELEKELNTLKGEMPNPGSGEKIAGGLTKLTTAELNMLAAKEPSRTEEILQEIKRRNSQQ